MIELLLAANLVAGDMVCYADMGEGLVDMTYMCGVSGGGAVPAALSGSAGSGESSGADQPLSAVYGTYLWLPGVRDCEVRKTNAALNVGNYTPNMVADHLDECAAEIPVIATFNSPAGQLEIVEPVRNEGYWVRVPDDKEGYGPYDTRSQAQDFAENNFSQFFDARN